MPYRLKETTRLVIAAICCLSSFTLHAAPATPIEDATSVTQPPASSNGFYPLSQVHRGQLATAYTVFEGTRPEPMQVEIIGLLRSALGPNMDMILARLKGTKPEYTGVVAGMSGSPVYIDGKLLGSISYRIGEFSKEPIAGITPIGQMLEVQGGRPAANTATPVASQGMDIHPIETPLMMAGFQPEAIKLWQEKFAGTSLASVSAAGGIGGGQSGTKVSDPIVPGSAVSALLISGDLQVAATCTVTYVDPKQLLACGHPITQFGPVSMPMTKAEVLATLPSPLNAFKIVNTADEIGAFTDDRHSAIHGVFGEKANMIPVTLRIRRPNTSRELHFAVMDHPQVTTSALLVGVYQSLLESNAGGTDSSYRLKSEFSIDGYSPIQSEALVAPTDQLPGDLQAALTIASRFARLYSNPARQDKFKEIKLEIEESPKRLQTQLESAQVAFDTIHAGDTFTVEATLRPYQGSTRNIRIPVTLPASLTDGTIRLLVSDGATLDRILQPVRTGTHTLDMNATIAQLQSTHASDRLYVTLLLPSTQAGWEGRTLASLPLSMANVLEPLRTAQDLVLNGESGIPVTSIPVDAVLTGQQVIMLHVQ